MLHLTRSVAPTSQAVTAGSDEPDLGALYAPGVPTDLVVMGCDGEMSSDDIAGGGRLIQAGYAAMNTAGGFEVFNELISWPEMAWSPEAAAVHRLPREVVDAAPGAGLVDAACAAWLTSRGGVWGRRLILVVGFNVGAWDMPYFRQALPTSTALLSRRTLDLNAVCFTLDGWDPNPATMRAGAARDWLGWKKSAIKHAMRRLDEAGIEGREHDAGYDAALALAAWLFLREQVHASRTPSRTQADAPAGRGEDLVGVFGAGLLGRLAALDGVDETWLRTLTQTLPIPADEDPSKVLGRWMGRPHAGLGGRTALAALADGDHDAVLRLAAT